jgi:hypothetical protein
MKGCGVSGTEPDSPLPEPDWPGVKKRQAQKTDQVAAIAAGIGEYGIANACYRLAGILRQHATGDYSAPVAPDR